MKSFKLVIILIVLFSLQAFSNYNPNDYIIFSPSYAGESDRNSYIEIFHIYNKL